MHDVESKEPLYRGVARCFSWVLISVGSLVTGCDSGGAPDPSVLVRDSAGIRIVESATPALQDGSAWAVGAAPALSIGTVDGDDAYQLFRVLDAIRLEDGRVVLANTGSSEVRVFAPDGRFIETIARDGDGPGEVRSPRAIFGEGGDTILVVHNRGLSRFSLSEGFLGSYPPPLVQPRARLDDGSLIGLGFARGTNVSGLGQVRPSLAIVRFQPDTQVMDTLAVVSGGEDYRLEAYGGIVAVEVPFSGTNMIATRDGHVVTGDGSEWEITILLEGGRRREILRRPDVDRSVTSGLIAAEEGRLLDRAPDEDRRRMLRQVFREWTYPTRWPAFDRLLVDREGNVWARHYALSEQVSATWSVFDRGGAWLGEADLPSSFRVMEIGADYVLGVSLDELGVEYVRMHRLMK